MKFRSSKKKVKANISVWEKINTKKVELFSEIKGQICQAID